MARNPQHLLYGPRPILGNGPRPLYAGIEYLYTALLIMRGGSLRERALAEVDSRGGSVGAHRAMVGVIKEWGLWPLPEMELFKKELILSGQDGEQLRVSLAVRDEGGWLLSGLWYRAEDEEHLVFSHRSLTELASSIEDSRLFKFLDFEGILDGLNPDTNQVGMVISAMRQ